MPNFVVEFKSGQEGNNQGLPTGIPPLDTAINGLQKKTTIGLAAAPKVGKTTLCDYGFVLTPYLYMEKMGRLDDIEWIYFSFEIDRVSKEFKFAAFFMAYDHNQYTFKYKDKLYTMNQDYLQGKQIYQNNKGENEGFIPVSDEHKVLIRKIYEERIIPIFGEFDIYGRQITPGKIKFIEERDNPTGMWKLLLHYAEQNGEFIKEKYTTLDDNGKTVDRERNIAYNEKNKKKFTIVITDHLRRLKRERGFEMKQNIDKWLEYSTDLRNLCYFTFIHIVHSNRNLSNTERLQFAKDKIFPTGDDTKDSGNFAEECTILMTLFNARDEKYNLTTHFGVPLAEYPNYRSIHITESRYTECPVHIACNMIAGVNMFTPLN